MKDQAKESERVYLESLKSNETEYKEMGREKARDEKSMRKRRQKRRTRLSFVERLIEKRKLRGVK